MNIAQTESDSNKNKFVYREEPNMKYQKPKNIPPSKKSITRVSKKHKDRAAYMKKYRTGQEYKWQRNGWSDKHPGYYYRYYEKNKRILYLYKKQWREINGEQRRIYMREYMRRYRSKNVA
jgi:hypothetical protein